jgi:hypothetical protein
MDGPQPINHRHADFQNGRCFVQIQRIFRTAGVSFRSNYSTGYRGVCCPDCTTVDNDAQLIHADFTHQQCERSLRCCLLHSNDGNHGFDPH